MEDSGGMWLEEMEDSCYPFDKEFVESQLDAMSFPEHEQKKEIASTYNLIDDLGSIEKLKKLYKNILPSDWQNMKLIEYVKETLDELKMQGVRIALITNSHRDLISASLAYFQLDSYFDWVLAAGDVMLSKEERLGRIQQEAKVEKQEVLYVGDTAGDIIAAHHVGIDGALIINDYSWFFRQKEEMSIPNTEYVLKNISEILNI